jgi:hypothetical protein
MDQEPSAACSEPTVNATVPTEILAQCGSDLSKLMQHCFQKHPEDPDMRRDISKIQSSLSKAIESIARIQQSDGWSRARRNAIKDQTTSKDFRSGDDAASESYFDQLTALLSLAHRQDKSPTRRSSSSQKVDPTLRAYYDAVSLVKMSRESLSDLRDGYYSELRARPTEEILAPIVEKNTKADQEFREEEANLERTIEETMPKVEKYKQECTEKGLEIEFGLTESLHSRIDARSQLFDSQDGPTELEPYSRGAQRTQ